MLTSSAQLLLCSSIYLISAHTDPLLPQQPTQQYLISQILLPQAVKAVILSMTFVYPRSWASLISPNCTNSHPATIYSANFGLFPCYPDCSNSCLSRCYNQKDKESGRAIPEHNGKGTSTNKKIFQRKSAHPSPKMYAHRKDSTKKRSPTSAPSPVAVNP